MLMISIAFIALLLLISLSKWIDHYGLQKTVMRANIEQQVARVRYDNLAKTYPILASQVPILTQLKELEHKVTQTQNQYNAIRHYTLRRGFSIYMYGLAQASRDSTWIDGMNQNNGGTFFCRWQYAVL